MTHRQVHPWPVERIRETVPARFLLAMTITQTKRRAWLVVHRGTGCPPDPGDIPICRIETDESFRHDLRMEEPTKASDESSGLGGYWTVFCAALLISVVVYAVFTAG